MGISKTKRREYDVNLTAQHSTNCEQCGKAHTHTPQRHDVSAMAKSGGRRVCPVSGVDVTRAVAVPKAGTKRNKKANVVNVVVAGLCCVALVLLFCVVLALLFLLGV